MAGRGGDRAGHGLPRVAADATSSGVPSVGVSPSALASFLLPDGFTPPAMVAVLREASLVTEAGRLALRSVGERRGRWGTPYAGRTPSRGADPVVLVPGFLAGDGTLKMMSAVLRRQGFRT